LIGCMCFSAPVRPGVVVLSLLFLVLLFPLANNLHAHIKATVSTHDTATTGRRWRSVVELRLRGGAEGREGTEEAHERTLDHRQIEWSSEVLRICMNKCLAYACCTPVYSGAVIGLCCTHLFPLGTFNFQCMFVHQKIRFYVEYLRSRTMESSGS